MSGGKGITGSFLVNSVLAQFPDHSVPVLMYPDMTSIKKVEKAVDEMARVGGIIVQTMVNQKMRAVLQDRCEKKNVPTIDLVGDIMKYLVGLLNQEPLNQPGLYRKLNLEYFDRQESIDYSLYTDDGQNIADIHKADIVLCGVSRVGKTPLALYLAMHGWKVANVPIVIGMDSPKELFEVDHNRVFGLTINLNQLISLRTRRYQEYDILRESDYINPRVISQELAYAKSIFSRGKFTIINTTNKPVESISNEIIKHIGKKFSRGNRKTGRNLE